MVPYLGRRAGRSDGSAAVLRRGRATPACEREEGGGGGQAGTGMERKGYTGPGITSWLVLS